MTQMREGTRRRNIPLSTPGSQPQRGHSRAVGTVKAKPRPQRKKSSPARAAGVAMQERRPLVLGCCRCLKGM